MIRILNTLMQACCIAVIRELIVDFMCNSKKINSLNLHVDRNIRTSTDEDKHTCARSQRWPFFRVSHVFLRFKGFTDRDQLLFYLLKEKLTLLSPLPA